MDGRQVIAIRWLLVFLMHEPFYNQRVHQLFQNAILARVLGELAEVFIT